MTDRTLHATTTGGVHIRLEIRDTWGIHHLSIIREQGATLSGTGIDLPAHLANALIAATPASLATTPAKSQNDTPRLNPQLLRQALTVALWGEDNTDASVAAERAATVVERLLDPGNQIPPWTPEYAVGILLDEQNPDAVDPAPHMTAAARGVLGLPFPEPEKREGACVNLGPVMYGSPWDVPLGRPKPFGDKTLVEVEDEVIDAPIVDDDDEGDEGDEADAPEPEKVKPPKGKKVKPGKKTKGKALGRRIAVLRHIVANLNGDMPFPDGPKGPAWDFYVRSLEHVEAFVLEHGTDQFIYDPRGHVPDFGYGTPLDTLTVTELLELAAALPLTAFAEDEGVRDYQSFEDALKAVLHDVYSDLWSAVADGIAKDELTVDSRDQITLSKSSPEEETDDRLPVE